MNILDYLVAGAEWFIGLFQTGADVFLSWMSGIVPLVLVLLIAMNALIALIGEDRINKVVAKAGKNPVSRYLFLPFIGSFFLTNPAGFTLGRFLPERYKPSYYASFAQFCHTSNGVFPQHVKPRRAHRNTRWHGARRQRSSRRIPSPDGPAAPRSPR